MSSSSVSAPPSYKAILKQYNESTGNVRGYFSELPSLLKDNYSYEVSLAYLFLETERAHNRTLYCGVVKLHHADSSIADTIVNAQHITREGFLDLYKNIFSKRLPDAINSRLKKAEKIRDRVIHGKGASDPEMRQAHVDVIEYAETMNNELKTIAGFEPFGDLRGFKGRADSLDKQTSRWLLKGIGFTVS